MQIELIDRFGKSSATIELTPEQEKLVKKHEEGKELTQHNVQDVLYNIGLILPSQISSYTCNECGKTYQESLQVGVTIGELSFGTVFLRCTHCKKFVTVYDIDRSTLNKTPVEFIEYDETGDYKRPTADSIEELLSKIENELSTGSRLDSFRLRIAQNWADKINYGIPKERIDKFEEIDKTNYISILRKGLPELVEAILANSYSFDLSAEEEGAECGFDYLQNEMNELFQTIDFNIVPEDIRTKEGITEILFRYQQMFDERGKEFKRNIRDLRTNIRGLHARSAKARTIRKGYVSKLGLTKEQVQEVMNRSRDWKDSEF